MNCYLSWGYATKHGQYYPEGLSISLLNISIFLPWSSVSKEPKVTLNQRLYTLTTPSDFICVASGPEDETVHVNERAWRRPDGLWSHQLTNHNGPALLNQTSKRTTAKTQFILVSHITKRDATGSRRYDDHMHRL